jgi:predicted aspartyl protease
MVPNIPQDGVMIDDMGIFRTTITVEPLSRSRTARTIRNVMVDTGAEFSSLPRHVLESLGITPTETERFRSADGRVFERDIGFALIGAGGRIGPTVVIFAEPEDITLLGAHGLEALRLRIDLASKELVPAGPAPAAAAA